MSLLDRVRGFFGRFVVFEAKARPAPRPSIARKYPSSPPAGAGGASVPPVTSMAEVEAPAPSPPAAVPPSKPAATADVDLVFIYQDAGIPSVPMTAEQAFKTLAALPEGVPEGAQREVLKAAGKPLGTTAEAVSQDATRKLAALSAFLDEITQDESTFTVAAEREIGELQKKIADQRAAIEATRARAGQIKDKCKTEADRLRTVLRVLGADTR